MAGSSRGATRSARGIHGVLMGRCPVDGDRGSSPEAGGDCSIALQCKVISSRLFPAVYEWCEGMLIYENVAGRPPRASNPPGPARGAAESGGVGGHEDNAMPGAGERLED